MTTNEKSDLRKKVLIVFAHHDRETSFNAALLDKAVDGLQKLGHTVQISDLYAKQFNPCLNKCDLGISIKPQPDVQTEMDLVSWADIIVFQTCMYWSSVPAILKGWFDRVLADGYAFSFENRLIQDKGLMRDKRAIICLTTGCTKEMLTDQGVSGDIDIFLWHIQYGILRMCGFQVLRPQLSYAVPLVSSETREKYIQDWEKRLPELFTEQPLTFPQLSCYNENYTFTAEALQSFHISTHGPSIGHHQGKPLLKN